MSKLRKLVDQFLKRPPEVRFQEVYYLHGVQPGYVQVRFVVKLCKQKLYNPYQNYLHNFSSQN
ncbi:hypothetical protein CDG79_38600 [Nostoc sp. 'Peltigera membranacea cyanobiont' 232]|nr:hypothetical protein CDG79_38600 [Nostoc sp. 'Peltigera membranacea cyanobiont' 232]